LKEAADLGKPKAQRLLAAKYLEDDNEQRALFYLTLSYRHDPELDAHNVCWDFFLPEQITSTSKVLI